MSYWAIWLVIVILLAIMEAATVNLVSVWFIASGIVSLFLSLFVESFFIQFGVFVILGIILLLLTRPMLLKMIENKEHKTNLDRIIGMEGIVTSKIQKNITGEVKVDGKLWSAISNTTIEEGSTVKIISIESVKLVVEKLEEEKKELEEVATQEKKEEILEEDILDPIVPEPTTIEPIMDLNSLIPEIEEETVKDLPPRKSSVPTNRFQVLSVESLDGEEESNSEEDYMVNDFQDTDYISFNDLLEGENKNAN